MNRNSGTTTGTNSFANTLLQMLSQPESNSDILRIAQLMTNTHRDYLANMHALVHLLESSGTSGSSNTPLADITIDLATLFGGRQNTQSQGLTDSEIRNNTTISVYTPDQTGNNNVCPITLEAFREGESVSKINRCGHMFKTTGLNEWLRRHDKCPVCRGNVL